MKDNVMMRVIAHLWSEPSWPLNRLPMLDGLLLWSRTKDWRQGEPVSAVLA